MPRLRQRVPSCTRISRAFPCRVRGEELAQGLLCSGGMTTQPMLDACATPAASPEICMDFAASSHGGQVRRVNEDSFVIADVQPCISVRAACDAFEIPTGRSQGMLIAVADGMGGQGDGQLASRTALESMLRSLLNAPHVSLSASPGKLGQLTIPNLRGSIESAIQYADCEIRRRAAAPDVSSKMGTTLTLGYVHWPLLYVGHVGDSRAYLLRDGQLMQITTDHTVANRLAQEGREPVEPDSRLHHILYNCLGGGEGGAPQPEFHKILLQSTDKLLFCSDGLTNDVPASEIAGFLAQSQPSQVTAAQLVARANQLGGHDNITVVVGQQLET